MISAAPGLALSRDGFVVAAHESHLMLIVPAFLISLSPSRKEKRALINVICTIHFLYSSCRAVRSQPTHDPMRDYNHHQILYTILYRERERGTEPSNMIPLGGTYLQSHTFQPLFIQLTSQVSKLSPAVMKNML